MPSKALHAFLSMSAAHRWLICLLAPTLEAKMPPEPESPYAAEGTKAHELCEQKINKLLGKRKRVAKAPDPEMERCTDAYRDFVEEEWNAQKADTPDAKLFAEQRLDLSEWVPEGFGTSDTVIVSDTMLTVIDFKYGKGVPVDAKENPQLRLYALGAYAKFGTLYGFETVKTIIFQPRLDSITQEVISLDDLIAWGETYVKPRAQKAFNGEGEYVVGEHCRFCKAAAMCRARAEKAFEVIDHTETDPDLLDPREIPAILDCIPITEAWIKSIKEYALRSAVNDGVKWEGYKLVEARTQRKIENQIEALETLERNGYDREEVTNLKLKGLTDLTKIMGKKKFEELLSPYIVKPTGDPVLVPETDSRPEYNPLEQVFKEEIE